MERGRIQGLPNFFEYPLLSRERVKLRTSNGGYIHRVDANKHPFKIWENRERGRIQGLPNFLKYPLLSQEWQIYLQGPCEQKPIKYLRENGARTYTGTAQIF